MIIHKNYRLRLYPSDQQRQMFVRFAGCARFVYNWGLAERKRAWEERGAALTWFDQSNALTRYRNEPGMEWLRESNAQMLHQALKHLDIAYRAFFRGQKTGERVGYPKFKKKGRTDSFRYPHGVKLSGRQIYLPKIGWVRFRDSRSPEGQILQATVKREADRWFVSVMCKLDVQEPGRPKPTEVVGVDLGLKTFAVLSTEQRIENPLLYRQTERRIARAQRSLSRKKWGSQNRRKQVVRVARCFQKLRNQRRDFLHKNSTSIITGLKNHEAIAIETLRIAPMMKNRHISRAVREAGIGMFATMLEYKAGWQGKTAVRTDQKFPSSQLCSGCGERYKIPWRERTYSCSHCGLIIDRDLNAALNLRTAGRAVLGLGPNACGEQIRPKRIRSSRARSSKQELIETPELCGNVIKNLSTVGNHRLK